MGVVRGPDVWEEVEGVGMGEVEGGRMVGEGGNRCQMVEVAGVQNQMVVEGEGAHWDFCVLGVGHREVGVM